MSTIIARMAGVGIAIGVLALVPLGSTAAATSPMGVGTGFCDTCRDSLPTYNCVDEGWIYPEMCDPGDPPCPPPAG